MHEADKMLISITKRIFYFTSNIQNNGKFSTTYFPFTYQTLSHSMINKEIRKLYSQYK